MIHEGNMANNVIDSMMKKGQTKKEKDEEIIEEMGLAETKKTVKEWEDMEYGHWLY